MATATRKAKATAATPPPKAGLLEKPVTERYENFAVYVKDQTGYDLNPRDAQITQALYGSFQKSDTNVNYRQKLAAEREAEQSARDAAREERQAKRAARDDARAARDAEKQQAAAAKKSSPRKSTTVPKSDVVDIDSKRAKGPKKAATPAKRSRKQPF